MPITPAVTPLGAVPAQSGLPPSGQRGAFWVGRLAAAHTSSAAATGSRTGSGLSLVPELHARRELLCAPTVQSMVVVYHVEEKMDRQRAQNVATDAAEEAGKAASEGVQRA